MASGSSKEKSSFVRNISAVFNKEDDETDDSVCIFKIPHSLSSTKPEAYVPQHVGLGPYHHLRSELQHMQTYKLAEAKRILKAFDNVGFHKLVELLQELIVSSARSRYSTYLNMENEDLAYIMAIDGLYLFELLCFYGLGKNTLSNSEFFRKLVSSGERRLTKDSTLRDAMTLESQIPMVVLKVILIVESTQIARQRDVMEVSSVVRQLLPRILLGFCKAVRPLEVYENYPPLKALSHHHLLDLLYHLTVLKDLPESSKEEEDKETKFIEDTSSKVKDALTPVGEDMVVVRETEVVPHTETAVVQDTAEVPHTVRSVSISDVTSEEKSMKPGVNLLGTEQEKPLKGVEGLFGLAFQTLISSVQELATGEPPVEDGLLPRASKLCKAGIIFDGKDNHITNIRFNPKNASFHLPVIRLNVNSEVIIRNLVAYEAMIKSESKSFVLTRYLELMSGLIETAEDVKVLTAHGIILKSGSIDDEEIAKIFNGMGKPVRITKPLKDDDGDDNDLDSLERAIIQVKSYYNGLCKVSASKVMKKWGGITWKLGKVLVVLVLLLLIATQTFCRSFDCRRLHHVKSTSNVQRRTFGRKLNWV